LSYLLGGYREQKPATKAVKREKRIDETLHLSGERRGGVLKEEVWYEGNRVVKYSLAYNNPRICAVDNGRVLGYKTEEIEFSNYPALLARFERELHQLWKEEDE
jgi:hypothetical protein